MQDIYRGNIIPGRPGTTEYRKIKPVAYIFVCPDCEYRNAAESTEQIERVRDQHNATCHPDKAVDVTWADSPLSQITRGREVLARVRSEGVRVRG